MAQISIPDDQINNAVRSIVKDLGLVPREDLRAYCPPLDDVRKDYFRNHSKQWIRNLIFDRFPETLDVNGGMGDQSIRQRTRNKGNICQV